MGVSIWEGGKAERMASALETVANKLNSDKFTYEMKMAIIDMFSKVAFIDDNGQDYINELSTHLFSEINVSSVSAVFTQPQTDITTSTSLDSLKDNLVVTATYIDGTSETLDDEDYTLSGTLTSGKSSITVSYMGKTTTFDCLVIFTLAEATAFDGTNKLMTGWKTSYADNLSVCGDVTLTGFAGIGTADMIFSNIEGSETNYVGLCSRLAPNNAYELWGAGITYSNRSGNISAVNDRIRFVAVINTQTNTIEMSFKNVTQNISKTRSNTYSNTLSDTREISIGKPSSSYFGVIGTANSFKVYGRALTSAEISSYLGGN